ncbi:hypothetical protein BT93_A0271 [Corymbia citriodora subsp. variegata]|nr:hypothetical protein BT93_A0271 [Corymbia citriodora subsp. variegata]
MMKVLLLLFVFFGVSLCEVGNISEDDDAALEKQVKMMSKPPVKTFVTAEGDTIDCIDIDKQPSLEHPLLKNHKVQKEPTFHVTSPGRNFSRMKAVQFRLREPCPVGTVPIPRVTKKDLIRARATPKIPFSASSRLDTFQHTNMNTRWLGLWTICDPLGATMLINLGDSNTDDIKYGLYGRTSIYNVTVAQEQFSSHNVWIQSEPLDHVSMITVGWMVNPKLYGDSVPRMFTFWTGDGYRDGCYNLLCPGFVVVDGGAFFNKPLVGSTYGGDQRELAILVQQDRTTRNWWLLIGFPPATVGYWPKELLPNLQDGCQITAWGGVALAGSDGICPPIGSGQKPDGDYRHATYFRILHRIDVNGTFALPSRNVMETVDQSNVYGLKNHRYEGSMGYWIGYGGPGGKCFG